MSSLWIWKGREGELDAAVVICVRRTVGDGGNVGCLAGARGNVSARRAWLLCYLGST